jgi:hypothetical protein
MVKNKLNRAETLSVGGTSETTHVTTTATLGPEDVMVTCANTASTDYTITLPKLTEAAGRIYRIRCISDLGTGVINIVDAGDASFRTFNHVFQATTANSNVIYLICDQWGWDVLAGPVRVVTDGSMNATPGYYGETVWNTDDSILYTCSVASTTPGGAATWVGNT